MYEKYEMKMIDFSENDSFVYADKSEGSGWEQWSIRPERSDS